MSIIRSDRFSSVFLLGLICLVPFSLGFEPFEIRAGRVIRAEITVDEVEKLSLSELLLAGRFDPADEPVGDGRLRPPEAGKAYLILEVVLRDGKSIGKYDYMIQFRGRDQVYRCLAMARVNQVFDPRLWEVTADGPGFAPVRLLYETDEVEGEVEVLMVPALGLSITAGPVAFKVSGVSLD